MYSLNIKSLSVGKKDLDMFYLGVPRAIELWKKEKRREAAHDFFMEFWKTIKNTRLPTHWAKIRVLMLINLFFI